MRQETNNEMDLLLRRLARQQEISASSEHLDADELNSYAENVLPPAARARYTEHLAECGRCRELVVQLSSSAGVVVAQETARVSEPSALKKFLASLFSPMVLRYAVPALGLVVIAAIGFMVSRRDPGAANSPVAVVRDQQPAQAPVPATQPQPSDSTARDRYGFHDNKEPAANMAVRRGEADAQSGAVAPNAPTVAADVPQEKPTKTVDEVQPVAKEAPAPQPTPAVSESKKVEPEGRKQEVAEQTVKVQSETEKLKRDDSVAGFTTATPSVARNRAAAGVGRADAAKPMAQPKDAEKDDDEVETRTVAGRHFRKQGSVWVDTAYSSPRRITAEYTRGSEGYRTLVGDEPEIKRIADQLDGEIIIVWKGQVYKIR